ASNTAGGTFDATGIDSTVTTIAAMDSAGSRHEIGVSPFADFAASSSPSNVSIDHIPIGVLFESTSGGILDFFLNSDEDEKIGMSRVVADPDSDDEVLAEIIFRGKSISGDGVVLVDKLPDDEIVDPRVKVETVSDYASSPPRNRRKHLGVRSDDCLWDKPVEDFFSSESESDDDMENYIPPLPYGEFKDWEMSLHSDDVEDFWSTQDDWIVSSWKLYPKSSVHVLDLTNGKTVYMFVDKVYPIRATLLERMLRHRLTVPPSYCRDVFVAGNVIQTVQTGLRQAYECLASAPIACTARQMVFSSPWLTAKKESGSPLQTALVCNSNPLMVASKSQPSISFVLLWSQSQPLKILRKGKYGRTSPSCTWVCWAGKKALWDTNIQEKEQKESQKQTKPSMEWKGQIQKVNQVKKIQLEGLKLPKPQVVLQE
ncbi:hypothetical protein Tco_0739208, partial [Tanacetum coccineum]